MWYFQLSFIGGIHVLYCLSVMVRRPQKAVTNHDWAYSANSILVKCE